MRRLVKARLNYNGLTGMADDAALVVSELVTNAITHSRGTQITLVMSLHKDCLNISVCDQTPGRPELQESDDEAESGRGLQLIQWLTTAYGGAWGTSEDGATTWCRLLVGGEAR
jgi:anti-sigma regulatory factor (Ser/Thr protein kinase)